MARRIDGPDAGQFGNGRSGGRSKPDRDATATNPPPSRRSRPSSQQRRSKPQLPVSDGGLHGDSHIPTFGTWNVDGDQNYTGIFQAASQARKGEAAGGAAAPQTAPRGRGSEGSGDLYKMRHSKKRSSSWCCFRSRGA